MIRVPIAKPSRRPSLPFELLPPAGYGVGGDFHDRWTVFRKAMVVRAVRSGQIDLTTARASYGLSVEEFLDWADDLGKGGVHGLGKRAIQARRAPHSRSAPRQAMQVAA